MGMRARSKTFVHIIFLVLILSVTACNGGLDPNYTSLPTATILSPPKSSLAPPPVLTNTSVPGCPSMSSDFIYVVNPTVYDNVNAGLELGILEAIDVLQQALESHQPEWGQYTWQDTRGDEHGLGYYFWNKANAQMIGVNPRVWLVATGLELDWSFPSDSDLRDVTTELGVTLTQHYRDYAFNEEIQRSYPNVADPANYALYAFFDFDQEILIEWCETYVMLFDESPLYLPGYDKD